MKKILLMAMMAFLVTGCGKEKFSEINKDSNAVTTPEPTFLFFSAQNEVKIETYILNFYTTNRFVNRWAQLTVGYTDNGDPTFNTSEFNILLGNSPTLGNYNKVGGYLHQIEYVLKQISDENKRKSYDYLLEMARVMWVQTAIHATDYYGDMCMSEAFQGLYSNPPLIRPKYDKQEDIYTAMDEMLKNAVNILSKPITNLAGTQVTPAVIKASQETVYKGDYNKWIVYANSLRIKIAGRLIHANPSGAKSIVNDVVTNGHGFMKENSDDYRHNGNKKEYGAGNFWPGTASEGFVEFLKKNKDPRVRFFFYKNWMNSYVVQGFLDQGKKLPEFIKDQVVLSADGAKFIRWKSTELGDGVDAKGDEYLGEPWVRYQGMPAAFKSEVTTEVVDEYVRKDRYELTVNGNPRYYGPLSRLNMHLYNSNQGYDYPSMKNTMDYYIADGAYQYTDVIYGSSEVNLTLALFALQGVNIPGETPQTLFNRGVRNSVTAFDETARRHNMPYYEKEYDETTVEINGTVHSIAKPIKLENGEIDAMLTRPDYILDGNVVDNLEKVYIQLLVNAFQYSAEIYPIIKLGGVPKYESKVWQRQLYVPTKGIGADKAINIPRHFLFGMPDKSSINYKNYSDALTRQGFTDFSNPSPNKSETTWVDKNVPEWWSGPVAR